MADYYTHTNNKPTSQTRALASEIRDELDKIASSFALLPLPAALLGGLFNYAVDTGLANAYVITLGSAITSYTDGMTLRFKATNANTSGSTINVNGLGLRSILRPDGTALSPSDIFAGQINQISYSSTMGAFQLAVTPLAAVAQALGYVASASGFASAASSSAGAASSSAGAASSSATLSMQWAMGAGLIDGTYNSARSYAIMAFNSAGDANTAFNNANQAKIDAQAARDAAAASAVLAASTMVGTSATSQTIGAGSKTFSVPGAKNWAAPATRLNIESAGSPGNSQRGSVTAVSYNSGTNTTSVTVNVVAISGSGTYSDWVLAPIGADGPAGDYPMTVVTGTAVNAIQGNRYVLINAGASNITMPSSPTYGGAGVQVLVANGRDDNTVTWNGINHEGISDATMTIDDPYAGFTAVPVNSTYGWGLT